MAKAGNRRRFGDLVRSLRDELHISQEELAVRMGVAKDTAFRIEKSDTPGMQAKTFRRLAEALEMTPAALAEKWKAIEHGEPSISAPFGDNEREVHVPLLKGPIVGLSLEEHLRDRSVQAIVPRSMIGDDVDKAFAVYLNDDAMAPEFQSGDVLICVLDAHFEDGDPVVIELASLHGRRETVIVIGRASGKKLTKGSIRLEQIIGGLKTFVAPQIDVRRVAPAVLSIRSLRRVRDESAESIVPLSKRASKLASKKAARKT